MAHGIGIRWMPVQFLSHDYDGIGIHYWMPALVLRAFELPSEASAAMMFFRVLFAAALLDSPCAGMCWLPDAVALPVAPWVRVLHPNLPVAATRPSASGLGGVAFVSGVCC